MASQARREDSLGNFDVQLIGNFLSFASRGDRVGLNQMLREGIFPDVQDYDKRTALHLAASEGHASIVELLLQYKAQVNLKDRWLRTTVRHEEDSNEVDIDISELSLQDSLIIKQGAFGASEKVKWRGTWVVKTIIKRHISHPVKMVLSATDNTLLRELRHPNILQFLGSIVQGEEMILITEYLSKGLDDILAKKVRLDLPTALRYALDIARGMNYLHQHKPFPIVHNHLDPRNLLQDEGGHLKIGEYWVQMLYERIHPNQDNRQRNDNSHINKSSATDTTKDIFSFGFIFFQMLEGSHLIDENLDSIHLKPVDFEPKFRFSKCPARIQELIENCCSKDLSKRPSFANVIDNLEESSTHLGKAGCPVC
ncbi:integrin-linked protein kinase family [Actinidia rufa]|uniref:Integrin-linked protein kinase family n=1 Tax=Actinidia rufa TaxID=165716 RepID=A0A7J0H731_9ERIC|nr:integrin-linked protein kinase family [Actinidia rufa]